MVANLLQGLWTYLYREGRFFGVSFEFNDDVWGVVGVGKVSVSRESYRRWDFGQVGSWECYGGLLRIV